MRRNFATIGADTSGVAALEFSMIAMLMISLLLGAFDLGNAAQQQIRLHQAVRAGTAYGTTFPTDTAGIQAKVLAALPSGWSLTSPPAVSCSCLDPSTNAATATSCALPTCTAPATGKLLSVTATMPYASLTPLFAGAIPNNTASHVIRYQ